MNYDWQSGALQSTSLEAFFRVDRQAGSMTAQTYYHTRF